MRVQKYVVWKRPPRNRSLYNNWDIEPMQDPAGGHTRGAITAYPEYFISKLNKF